MTKKGLIYLASLLLIGACSDNNVITNVDDELNQTFKHRSKTRSIDDVVALANLMETRSRSAKDYEIEVITTETTHPLSRSGERDTLLYFVSNAEHPLIISADESCYPYLAIFDNKNGSLINTISNPTEDNAALLSTLELPLTDRNTFNEIMTRNPVTGLDEGYVGGVFDNVIVSEIDPKVKVEWNQWSPFNDMCPASNDKTYSEHCAAGCVAIAGAQACTVTRHFDNYKGINLDWDKIELFKNGTYRYVYPELAVTIADFIHKIGIAVDMDYSDVSSGADTKKLISRVFLNNRILTCSENKADIEYTLRMHKEGIVVVSSRTKSDFLGIPRGVGHCYIIDGYKKYDSGKAFLHVNFGQGYNNGYFIQNLISPYFSEDSPWNYGHEWHFYCLYKK